MNKPINFQLATLLKLKGFANTTPHKLNRDYYNHKGELHGDVTDYIKAYVDRKDVSKLNTIDAPSIAEVVMWLYESHDAWIKVSVDEWFKDEENKRFSWHITSGKYTQIDIGFSSPTEAYESAIEYILKNLINDTNNI